MVTIRIILSWALVLLFIPCVNVVSAQSTAAGTTLGPVLPEQIQLPSTALTEWLASHYLRFFGWADGAYTGSSTGPGLLEVQPRPNRFGDAWLLNQAAVVLERTLSPAAWPQRTLPSDTWWWGYRAEFYMGADAALLRPANGFGPQGPRFGTDFRQAYFSLHAPLLTDGGIDIKFGRQYTPLGYETTMAPYRPMYSEAYVWFYSQNGATTGVIATIHLNPRLDVTGGVTLGLNSLFDFRGRAPCYIVHGLYWVESGKRTKLVATVYTGPEPIAAAPGRLGKWETEVEVQLVHDVNRRLTLVSETNVGWNTRDPGNQFHASKWVGNYGIAIIHAHRLLDVNSRAEWFHDIDGSRTGNRTSYGEIAMGVNFMPARWMNFRPEVRWDGAHSPVFGPTGSLLQSQQWTGAFEMLLKF